MIAKMFAQGKSAHAVACMLTEKKIPTARGGTWTAVQVNAIARRLDPDSSAAARRAAWDLRGTSVAAV
jgi:Recombinase